MYDEKYMSSDFNYEDLEKQYQDSQDKTPSNPAEMKKDLDDSHKNLWDQINALSI